MGVRFDVAGLLVSTEFAAEDGGVGFLNATVLPDGSRETLNCWAFGDNPAGHELLQQAEKAEATGTPIRVAITVEVRAKLNKAGNAANLSAALVSCVTEDGLLVNRYSKAA